MNTDTPMSTTQERAALATELEAVESTRADLEAERERIKPRPSTGPDGWYLMPSANPRHGEVLSELSSQECQAGRLRDEIARLDKIIAHKTRLAGAVDEALAARVSWQASAARAVDLERQAANLLAKVDALRAQTDASESESLQAEDQASREYARAVAAGDAKAEKAASAHLQGARDDAVKAAIAAGQRRGLIAAMEAEIVDLDNAAEVANSEAEEARRRMLKAISVKLKAEFDAGMADMLDLLARIARADHGAGLSSAGWMSKLIVPKFAPGGLDWIGDREVQRRAAELNLGHILADLDSMSVTDEGAAQ